MADIFGASIRTIQNWQELAVRRRQLRAKVRRNPRQRAPRQQQNGQRILHPPWRLRMRARRKRG
ncbi:TPA: hypothetical protein HNC16_08625 [Escherichia coli HVH 101 (4-6859844)]|nr:hypothetical protein [Escherichia coli HVH 101 (4-6859844)]